MQRLIDANEILKHKEVCELDDGQSFEYIGTDTINNALTVMTIPDNATIGDVIMGILQSNAKFAHDWGIILNTCAIEESTIKIEIGEKLWNASYKAESEG
ncbi:MAG: hypothetical protein J6Y78_08670 [Paludibacteraceae bacterium]|nr:hypothetical protein [Paludibacteraceae bacterium]